MTLAVLTGVLGAPSETFVARHIRELVPGETVVVARRVAPDSTWSHDGPTLLLDDIGAEWWSDAEQEALGSFLQEHGVTSALAEFLDLWVGFIDRLTSSDRRIVAHAHGYDVSRRLREPWWCDAYRGWRHAGAVVTMSSVSRDRLIALGMPASKVHVVPYGVDVSPDPPPARQPSGATRCLAVGRLVAKKDPLTLLKAVRRAGERGAHLVVDVIGDGPLGAEAREFAAKHRLPVVFHGAQPNAVVQQAMRDAEIFLQHSRTDPDTGDEEGLPVAVLEAMASGLPVVATHHAGIPEAVDNGTTGLLVAEGDLEGMTDALVRLAGDIDRRTAMGLAGWRCARERFTWEQERDDLRQLLDV